MEPFQMQKKSSVPYFALVLWQEEYPHLTVGFSAREEDSSSMCHNYALHVEDQPSRVIENRKSLVRDLSFSLDSFTCGEQVHGIDIAYVTGEDRGRGNRDRESAFSNTDGLFSSEEDILLASFYADCVPLFFYAPDIDAIGVAHAGWKGTVQKIGPKMVTEMVSKGADISKIRVAIGPSIGACCYEVDEHVLHPMMDALECQELSTTVALPTSDHKAMLDLKEANAQLFKQIGLRDDQIVKSKYCTSCSNDYFHSYRRDKGDTGRMMSFIGKRGRS
ncbi:YfiH family protein [Croceifilum oryzae]|uniref:Purine nucleoside phosphorylase n=1 Tax=Croceifilum oryzae TaxID=1553429 RepID=A0AAJ1TCL8_9BACL|nr:peptidoglycan editing factor PgeF [Croceifilum oryzae]MDQ0416405.1 YfiH family protein [Croceifilum oryzae]